MTTSIEWTRGDDGTAGETWNPVSGCTKVSQGCKHCYAERVFPRTYGYRSFTDVQTHADRLEKPLRWKKPRRVFVNSMSDLFHEDVPNEFIARVFSVMARATQHTFQILTKRPARMKRFIEDDVFFTAREGGETRMVPFLRNVWLGVSVEDQETADERIPLLLQTPAAVRFVSAEPLLGPVDFTHIPVSDRDVTMNALRRASVFAPHIDWVIVGGESGPRARECELAWIRGILRQAHAAAVPVFVKQLGRSPCELTERRSNQCPPPGRAWRVQKQPDGSMCDPREFLRLQDPKGGDPLEWPEDLRVREFPAC